MKTLCFHPAALPWWLWLVPNKRLEPLFVCRRQQVDVSPWSWQGFFCYWCCGAARVRESQVSLLLQRAALGERLGVCGVRSGPDKGSLLLNIHPQRAETTTACMTCLSSSKSPGRTTGSRWWKATTRTAPLTRSSTPTWSPRSPRAPLGTWLTPSMQRGDSFCCSTSSSSSGPGGASWPLRSWTAPDPCLRSSPTARRTPWTSFSPPRTSSRWFPSKMQTWLRVSGRISRCSYRRTERSCTRDARRWTPPSWTRRSRASWRRRPRPARASGSARGRWRTGSWWDHYRLEIRAFNWRLKRDFIESVASLLI